MAPYTIHCTTCHAALRVTNAAAIGQILACPKCGSMVQVTPPTPGDAGSVVVGAPGVPAVVATATSIGGAAARSTSVFASDIEQLAAEAASLLPGGSKSSAVPKAIPVAARASASAAVAPATAPMSATAPVSATVAVTVSPPPLPKAPLQQQSATSAMVEAVAKSSEASKAASGNGWWVGMTAAVAATLSLVAVSWGVWEYLQREPADRAVAQADGEQAIASVDASAVIDTANESDASVAAKDEAGDRAAKAQSENEQPAPSNVEQPRPNVVEEPNLDAVSKQADVAKEQRAANEAVTASDAPGVAQAETQDDGDHTAAKPTLELSDVPKSEAGKVAAEAESALGLPELPAAVGDAALVQEPLVNPAVTEVAEAPAADGALAVLPLKRIAPAKIDVAAQLGQKLPSVEVEDLPLFRFVALASEWSNVPIAIDLDGVRSRGIALDAPIQLSKQAVTLRQAIDAAIAPHRLELALADGHGVVRPADSGKTRKARYVVGDLVRPGDPAIAELAEMIRGAIGLPSDEQNAGARLEVATDTLYLTATDETHDRMIELCEKLRVARGRPLRTRFDPARPDVRFDPRRFELSTRSARAKAVLSRRVTAGIGTAAPLSSVVEYLSRRSGAALCIDAAALAEAELSLHTECRLQADDEPLAVALARLVAPLELTYRVFDERTIQITTLAAAADKPDLELYSVRGLVGGDDIGTLVARLEQRLTEATGANGMELAYDPPSQTLIVTAPSAVQAKVEMALGKLRAVEGAAGEKVSGVVR